LPRHAVVVSCTSRRGGDLLGHTVCFSATAVAATMRAGRFSAIAVIVRIRRYT
jgi:hypothetical protein